jgi:inner membrane protein
LGQYSCCPTRRSKLPTATPSEVTRYLSLLPDTLSSTGSLALERRHRGIYEAVVYRAGLHVQGVFRAPPLADLGVTAASVRWSEAFVALGISDLKGIRSGLALRWDGQARPFEPGLPTEAVLPYGLAPTLSTQVSEVRQERVSYSRVSEEDGDNSRGDAANGLQALVPLANEAALTQRHTFAFDLDLNGSTSLL